MAKKIYAVTNIKIDNGPEGVIAAGSVIDQTKSGLSKAQLLQLHEAGAVEVRDDAPVKEETPTPEVKSETGEGSSEETPDEDEDA